ncbi:MAG: electron transfer flavoprotein beta subunit/FixA family protein, partial [Actinomycetota bacterium]|nr:electron transfer flavoprotein beta subunit/FixA family protein [Actinomycetota bacterium]
MRLLVCVKRVPAPGARINITDDEQDVDAAHLGFTTSPHEECALEEAVQIVEEHGGEVTVLTLGPAEAEEQLRYAASVGAHHFVLLPVTEVDWDPQRTANALVKAIENLEENAEPFDLVLFGNESADSGGFQVGVRVAHALDRPMVNGIKGIEIAENKVTARREIDGGFEVYAIPTPAVLGVKEGINLP